MKIRSWTIRIVTLAFVCLVAITSLRSMTLRSLDGHRSSLRAKVTTVDGTQRTIMLQGVGCNDSICSRVVVGCVKKESLWLDSIASIGNISPSRDGSVQATFRFRNGGESEASIVSNNRVLYVDGLWRTQKLDLSALTSIDFLAR
jgi:hypothetical protein